MSPISDVTLASQRPVAARLIPGRSSLVATNHGQLRHVPPFAFWVIRRACQ